MNYNIDETLKIDVTIKALFTAQAAYLFFYFVKNLFLLELFLVQLGIFVSVSLLIVLLTFLNLSLFLNSKIIEINNCVSTIAIDEHLVTKFSIIMTR